MNGNSGNNFSRGERRTGELTGQQIGPYVLDAIVGVGTYNTVYHAQHPLLRAERAVKILRPELASQSAVQQFVYEAKVAANLNHPNIVHIYDFGNQPPSETLRSEYHWIGMEYVSGSSLSAIFNNERRPAPEIALSLVRQIGEGLEYAHQRGVVHNDVKPGNILLGRNSQVKITDFGSARKLDWTALRNQNFAHTVNYAAPEVLNGEQGTVRSDVYSFGVVSFELLTGKLPGTEAQVNQQTLESALSRPETYLNPRLRGGLVEAVLQQLSQDPSQRPESLEDYLRLLDSSHMFARSYGLSRIRTRRDPGVRSETVPSSVAVENQDSLARDLRLLLQRRDIQSGLAIAGLLAVIFIGLPAVLPKSESLASPPATALVSSTSTEIASPAAATPEPARPVGSPEPSRPAVASPTPEPARPVGSPEPARPVGSPEPARPAVASPSPDARPAAPSPAASPGASPVTRPGRIELPPGGLPDSKPRIPIPPGGLPDSKPRGFLTTNELRAVLNTNDVVLSSGQQEFAKLGSLVKSGIEMNAVPDSSNPAVVRLFGGVKDGHIVLAPGITDYIRADLGGADPVLSRPYVDTAINQPPTETFTDTEDNLYAPASWGPDGKNYSALSGKIQAWIGQDFFDTTKPGVVLSPEEINQRDQILADVEGRVNKEGIKFWDEKFLEKVRAGQITTFEPQNADHARFLNLMKESSIGKPLYDTQFIAAYSAEMIDNAEADPANPKIFTLVADADAYEHGKDLKTKNPSQLMSNLRKAA